MLPKNSRPSPRLSTVVRKFAHERVHRSGSGIRYARTMERRTAAQRRDRTQAIVEGALLADIALVFLLMRAFLPVPGARQLIRALATIPFVMLVQRRGVKLTIMAAVAGFILFSALVGPLLGLAAVDIAVAGVLIGIGRRLGFGPVLNTLWTGPVYAFLDVLIPTIAAVWLFHYPVSKLIQAAKTFIGSFFSFFISIASRLGMSPAEVHQLNDLKAWNVVHWQVGWLASYAVYGVLTTYLAVIAAQIVLKQLPDEILTPQRVAA